MIAKSNCKFFFSDNQYFVAVKLPIGVKPVCYMAMGMDNRPFETIINDINTAFEMLVADYHGEKFLMDVNIAYELPRLLGYKRATAGLKV